MTSLVVIPTYNEKDNIREFVQAVLENTPESTHLLVVDDNSPDGTGEIADSLSTQNARIHVLHRSQKEGLGAAYRAGFKWGLEEGAAYLIQMDADFSHNPCYLPTMQENLTKGASLVIGSRYVRGGGTENWGWMRKLISRGGGIYSRALLRAPLSDFTGGFNGWRRETLQKIAYDTVQSEGYCFQIEMKYRAHQLGEPIVEFPIIFEDRRIGTSKMSGKIVLEAMWRVAVLGWKGILSA